MTAAESEDFLRVDVPLAKGDYRGLGAEEVSTPAHPSLSPSIPQAACAAGRGPGEGGT